MIHPVFIGCDVAKAHLDLFDGRTSRHIRIDNTAAAIHAWLQSLEGQEATVILEATGRYDRQLRAALDRQQRPYCRVNPARAR
ncbi:MAG: IS110 family transposase, partial [Rhizobium oryzihabitans]